MKSLLMALKSNIKPQGRDHWVARCPVHNDKDFAMSIVECADGSILAFCHACGANGLALYEFLGLDLKELFGGKEGDRISITKNMRDDYSTDKYYKKIYEAETKTRKPTLEEFKRNRLAIARAKGIEGIEKGQRSVSEKHGKNHLKKLITTDYYQP